MSAGPAGAAAFRNRLRRTALVVAAILYGISIPWYRATGSSVSIWVGLPDWVAVALGAYAAAAILTALAWLLTDIPDREGDP